MDFNPLDSVFDFGKSVIERIWPDETKRAEEMRKLEELRQNGDLARLDAHVKLMLGQLEVNTVEAQHKSIFVAGWRPFIGWAGGFSLVYAGVVYPLLTWFWAFAQAMGWFPENVSAPPLIETGILGTIVTGMLGIGTMRSYDKKQGTQTDLIRNELK